MPQALCGRPGQVLGDSCWIALAKAQHRERSTYILIMMPLSNTEPGPNTVRDKPIYNTL